MGETEEEVSGAKCNASNVTMDTISPFHHCTISPSQRDISGMTSTHNTNSPSQGEIKIVTSERQIYLDMLAETINKFNELRVQ